MTLQEDLLKFGDWTLSIAEDGTVVDSGPVEDFEDVEPEAQLAVEGETPSDRDLFLYVLQMDEADHVAVLYHPAGETQAGSRVRIPAQDWLPAKIDGAVIVVGSSTQVQDDQWASLLHGRDPDMGKGSTGTTVVSPDQQRVPRGGLKK